MYPVVEKDMSTHHVSICNVSYDANYIHQRHRRARSANAFSYTACVVRIATDNPKYPKSYVQCAMNSEGFSYIDDVRSNTESKSHTSSSDLSSALLHVPGSSYNVIRVDRQFQSGHSRFIAEHVSRRELLRASGLRSRDLRAMSVNNNRDLRFVDTYKVSDVLVNDIFQARAPFNRMINKKDYELEQDWSSNLNNSSPTFLVRENSLLLCFGSVRAIVRADYAMFFEPVPTEFMRTLKSRLDTNFRFSQTDDSQNARVPFELEIVEAILASAVAKLDTVVEQVGPRVAALLRARSAWTTPGALEQLRIAKQGLVSLDSAAGALERQLEDLLEEEEDLVGINLSRMSVKSKQRQMKINEGKIWPVQDSRIVNDLHDEDAPSGGSLARNDRKRSNFIPHSNLNVERTDILPITDDDEEEDEAELLLEYYLQRTEIVHTEAERLLEATRELEDSISVSLSSRRYEVNRFELFLAIFTFPVAVGSMISSIFGMNLRSTIEHSVNWFWGTCAFIIIGCVMSTYMMIMYLRNKRVL